MDLVFGDYRLKIRERELIGPAGPVALSALPGIRIDLGRSYALDHIALEWEAAYGAAFRLQVSADGNWLVMHRTDDFQNVEVDRISPGGTAWGAGALTPPAGAQVGQDLRVWSFRTQYAF